MKDYDRLEVYVRKSEKAKIRRLAYRQGLSVSKFVVTACFAFDNKPANRKEARSHLVAEE